jgi:superfamily II DNA helicase RecQ
MYMFQVNQTIIQSLSSESTPIRLIFATVALGMGADLRRVQRIVHAGPPGSRVGN